MRDAVVDNPHWLLRQEGIPAGADRTPVPSEVPAGHCHFHHCKTFHGSYGNSTDNPRRSYIMHLMPGHTRRLGNNWNERMGNVETVGVGEPLRGEDCPGLMGVPRGSDPREPLERAIAPLSRPEIPSCIQYRNQIDPGTGDSNRHRTCCFPLNSGALARTAIRRSKGRRLSRNMAREQLRVGHFKKFR